MGLGDLKETLMEEFSSATPKKKAKTLTEASAGHVVLMDKNGVPLPVPTHEEDPRYRSIAPRKPCCTHR